MPGELTQRFGPERAYDRPHFRDGAEVDSTYGGGTAAATGTPPVCARPRKQLAHRKDLAAETYIRSVAERGTRHASPARFRTPGGSSTTPISKAVGATDSTRYWLPNSRSLNANVVHTLPSAASPTTTTPAPAGEVSSTPDFTI